MRTINFSRSVPMTDEIYATLYPATQLLAAIAEKSGIKVTLVESTKTKGSYFISTECLMEIYEYFASAK